jgi:predicted nucleic acid-binding Zn ribbon protein
MSFEPLNYVLGSLQKQERWQEHQQFQRLLQCWAEVVGPVVSAQTRPTAISNRSVLWITTSSSVWAQNLAFERHRILEKLNARLINPLADVRFSTKYWQNNLARHQSLETEQPWRDHPSWIFGLSSRPEKTGSKDSNSAFQRWASTIQARSRQLVLCPKCQCPTPPGELKRWSVCALCATQQWK